jgi:hypothetical protein
MTREDVDAIPFVWPTAKVQREVACLYTATVITRPNGQVTVVPDYRTMTRWTAETEEPMPVSSEVY